MQRRLLRFPVTCAPLTVGTLLVYISQPSLVLHGDRGLSVAWENMLASHRHLQMWPIELPKVLPCPLPPALAYMGDSSSASKHCTFPELEGHLHERSH